MVSTASAARSSTSTIRPAELLEAQVERIGDAGAARCLRGREAEVAVEPREQAEPRAGDAAEHAAGALLLLYGVGNLVEHVLMKTGATSIPDGLGAHALPWHLWLWDPYWILGGVLFLLAARATRRAGG